MIQNKVSQPRFGLMLLRGSQGLPFPERHVPERTTHERFRVQFMDEPLSPNPTSVVYVEGGPITRDDTFLHNFTGKTSLQVGYPDTDTQAVQALVGLKSSLATHKSRKHPGHVNLNRIPRGSEILNTSGLPVAADASYGEKVLRVITDLVAHIPVPALLPPFAPMTDMRTAGLQYFNALRLALLSGKIRQVEWIAPEHEGADRISFELVT